MNYYYEDKLKIEHDVVRPSSLLLEWYVSFNMQVYDGLFTQNDEIKHDFDISYYKIYCLYV